MNYVIDKFENVTSFVNFLNTKPSNKVFADESSHYSKRTDRSHWFGTTSFEEAQELFKFGDKAKMHMVQKSFSKLNLSGSGYETRRKVKTSVVGFVPHIPNFLQGKPDCMINIVKEKIKSPKVLNIVYNIAVPDGTKAEDMADAGAKVLTHLRNMEAQGYRCNLSVMVAVRDDKRTETSILLVKIKSSNQHLDLLKVAYPLVNPSMLRRHHFRYLEVSKITKPFFNWTYGIPIKEESEVRKALGASFKCDYYFNHESAMALEF